MAERAMMMNARWRAGTMVVAVGSWLVGSGCTRENPAFGDTEGTAATSAASGSTGESSGMTRGSTQSDPVDSTTPDGTSTTEPAGTDAPGSESSGGDMLCPLHPPAPIEIGVHEANGDAVPLSKGCTAVITRPNGMIAIAGGTVQHQVCGACNCGTGEGITIDLGDTLQPPAAALPTCGKLFVWEGLDVDGQCRWDGFAILAQNETVIPEYVAMNSRKLPAMFGQVPIDLEPDGNCEELPHQCPQAPGRYALDFTSGPAVSVDMDEHVGIAFFAEVDYLVDNRMASIDLECGEHVAWTALRSEL